MLSITVASILQSLRVVVFNKSLGSGVLVDIVVIAIYIVSYRI